MAQKVDRVLDEPKRANERMPEAPLEPLVVHPYRRRGNQVSSLPKP